MKIGSLPFAFSVQSLQEELAANVALWNEYPWRTQPKHSPHREASDIWVRYNSLENLGPHFNDEHEAVWYPAAEIIPSARRIAETIADLRGQDLAGVLITRIPPGAQVYPHIDRGWHAENTDKIAVLVRGNRAQRFCFEDATHTCDEGDCFWFVNQYPHWVKNDTDKERVTLIVCLRKH